MWLIIKDNSSHFQVVIIAQAIMAVDNDAASLIIAVAIHQYKDEKVWAIGLYQYAFLVGQKISFIINFKSQFLGKEGYLLFNIIGKYGQVFNFHRYREYLGYGASG